MLILSTLALATGFLLDLVIGDPQGWPHIARFFGALIARLEAALYPMRNKRLGGTLLALVVLAVSATIPAVLLGLALRVSPWLYFALESVLIWQLLAARSLAAESGKVYRALAEGSLPAARRALAMIVGRDTQVLDEAAVTCAAVETVAENASDGVVAPLFFILLGGAPLGCLYKAANTMDSMIGYKNKRYIDFGCFAARFDDILNFLPSRLCALLMTIAARPCGLSAAGAYRIWMRDRRNHPSPNSAQPESAAAGALGIRLGGDAYYAGVLHKKPHIGDDTRPVEARDIVRCQRLLCGAAVLMLLLSLLVRGVVCAAI